MDEYIKKIKLQYEADSKSVSDVKKLMSDMTSFNLIDEKSAKKVMSQFEEYSKNEKVIAKLQKDIATLNQLNTKESKAAASALSKQLGLLDKGGSGKMAGALAGIATKFVDSLKSLFSSSLDRLSDMTKYGFMTDSSVREMKLGYGLSSSQAYGMSTALSTMGFGSMEDLMWADSKQLELFREAFNKYTEYYEETMTPEYLEKQMEYQVEMTMFKQDLEHEVIGFFMDNKDTIMKFMDFGMKFMEAILGLVGNIFDAFSSGGRSEATRVRETQSILNSYTSNNKSTSVSFTNNFNAADNDVSQFSNMSTQIYKQVIDVLERG